MLTLVLVGVVAYFLLAPRMAGAAGAAGRLVPPGGGKTPAGEKPTQVHPGGKTVSAQQASDWLQTARDWWDFGKDVSGGSTSTKASKQASDGGS